jgi:hypothetical protein
MRATASQSAHAPTLLNGSTWPSYEIIVHDIAMYRVREGIPSSLFCIIQATSPWPCMACMTLLCHDASASYSAMLSAALGHAQLSGTRAFYTAEPLVHESGMNHCVYINLRYIC